MWVDKGRIAETGLRVVKEALLNLIPWDPDPTLGQLNFKDCAYWVQIHNMFPNSMHEENVVELGEYIGKLVKVDKESIKRQVK